MGHKSEAESMQELTSLMWNRYLKERVKEEQNHEMNAYKAEVVTNNGDGTLTVKRPFESVNLTLKAASSLQYAQPGDMVLVVGIGDKSKALSNAFILCKTDLSDDTDVPVYGMGENLLDNWYFAGGGTGRGVFPVNQRGKTSYTGNTEFCIDRWQKRGSGSTNWTLELQSDGIHCTFPTHTELVGLNQSFKATDSGLIGKTVTLSVLVKDYNMTSTQASYPRLGLYSANSTYLNSETRISTLVDGNGLFAVSGVVPSDAGNYTYLNFSAIYPNAYASGSLTIVAAKLELGTQQTLAHLENGEWVLNEVPDYEEELLKCQTSFDAPNDIYANGVVSLNTPKPNLLDNWYFVGGGSQQGGQQFPLNHRGQTQYIGSVQSLDRWFNNGSGTTITINSDRLDITGGSPAGYLAQYIDWGPIKGKLVTYSILYNDAGTLKLASGTGTVPTSAPASGNTTTIVNVNSQVTHGTGCGVYLNSSGRLWVQIGTSSGYTVKYLAVKLEVGTDQTLAWMNGSTYVISEAPNYTEQLERCFTSFADSNDGNSGFYPVGGRVSAAGNPYLRFLVDSNIYQFVIASSGNLLIQKNINNSTWTTVAEYAHV